MAPTLLANAINAGSPFSTTYGAVDVTPPEFSSGILWRYAADMQFVLLVLAGGWTVLMLRWYRGQRQQANGTGYGREPSGELVFFLTHPVFTPYYTIPVAMLSLVEPAVRRPDGAGGSGGRPAGRAGGKGLIMLWEFELAGVDGQAFRQ